MGFFRLYGRDKSGRPLVWIRGAYCDPAKMTVESAQKFAAYTLDYCTS